MRATFSSALTTVTLIAMSTSATAETTVIEAAQYLDVVTGSMVSPAVIVIEGDRIVGMNPTNRPAEETCAQYFSSRND